MYYTKFFRICIFTILIFTTAACSTTVRQHPKFANSWKKQYSVAFIPPQVTVELKTFDGTNRRLTQQESIIANNLSNTLGHTFKARGYKVVPFNFEQLLQENPSLRFELEQVRGSYNSASANLYKTLSMDNKKASDQKENIGGRANIFSHYSQSDIIVLTKYSGFEKSKGNIAKDVAITIAAAALGASHVSPTEGGIAEVALIDGATGDVLWANKGGAQSVFDTDVGKMALNNALLPLPNKTLDGSKK